MRKVLSFVLVLALVMGSFSMAFADTSGSGTVTMPSFTDVSGAGYEDAVTVLSALGVVTGYPDGTYKPEQTVTRAEMAKLIISELGLESSASGATTSFKDMSGYGWAAGFVGYAQSLGIIEGYGDGTFRPGKTVSNDEAITMIVRAIGYTEDVKEMNGTWPAVFTQKANVLGITDDVKAGGSAGANRGDIAIMLYNALTCTMGYADADGVFIEKEDKDGNPIKMADNLDVEESDDYFIIRKSDADDAVVNIYNYIGAYAKVFTVTDGDNEDCIIAVSDVKSEFITGEYQADDGELETPDGTVYDMDDVMDDVQGTSNEMEDANIDEAVAFINSETVADARDTGIFSDADGSDFKEDATGNINCRITLAADVSGKTIKGVYSVLKWEADAEGVLDADDVADIEANHSLLGKDFAEDDNGDIDLNALELNGVASLSDIKEGNVVYIFENDDDEIARIDVGTKTVSGEVTKVNSDGDEVTISGTAYAFTSTNLVNNGVTGELMPNDIDTGDLVSLVLDAYGYAYDYDLTSGGADDFAIVLDTGVKDGNKISDNNEIELFTNTGDDIVFEADDDLFDPDEDLVPGYTTNGAAAWDVKATAGAFVKYGLDKDGIIDSMDNLYDDDYDVVMAGVNDEYDLTSKGYYNGYEIQSNAVIFTFDGLPNASVAAKSDEDNYNVTSLSNVLGSDDTIASYVLDDNKIVAMLIYDYSSTDGTYGVVTDKSSNNSDAGYEIDFFINEKAATYNAEKAEYNKVSSDSSDMAKGFKLWRIELDASGDISELKDAFLDGDDTYATASAIVSSGAVDADTDYSSRIFEVITTNAAIAKLTVVVDGTVKNVSKITLDSQAVVYYDDGGDFAVGSLSDLRDIVGKTLYFYDVVDEDGVFDVVLISDVIN